MFEQQRKILAHEVRKKVKTQHRSLDECVKVFNNHYVKDICDGKIPSLNKDFLSRIQRGNFKVATERISKLCEFLEIEPVGNRQNGRRDKSSRNLSSEIQEFNSYASAEAPGLTKKYPRLFQFLQSLLTLDGDSA